MSIKFIRIEPEKEGVQYLNISTILAVWPVDKRSFDSGAAVEVAGVDSSHIYLIAAGEQTSHLVDALGL